MLKSSNNTIKVDLMISYANLLKEYDLKVTPQRLAIVDELQKNGHMNIDDLYKKLLSKFPSISLATIYKNINAMIEKLFLHEVKVPELKPVYELAKAPHAHLVCSSCGYIKDIELDFSQIIEQASSISNFKIDCANIILSGKCSKPNCVLNKTYE